MKRSILIAALALGLLPSSARALPIFVENFNTENGGSGELNYAGFSNFAIGGGTVDLIGNGFYDYLPGNGLYIDLDGSTQDAGVMITTAPIALGPGNYVLSYDLAGNHVGGADSVNINVFGGLNVSYAFLNIIAASTDPFSTMFMTFTVLANDSVQFSFANAGGDNVGALLDNIELNQVAPVPEPGTLLMLGGGLALGALSLRRRRVSAA
jgi:hypothetical protein